LVFGLILQVIVGNVLEFRCSLLCLDVSWCFWMEILKTHEAQRPL
jgi:hypothetical protein